MAGMVVILRGDHQRRYAKELIDKAPQDAVVEIREATRTNMQNAKLHAMIGDLVRQKPDGRTHNVDVWRALLMQDANFKPIIEQSLDGQSLCVVGYKSSRLAKREFADLITSAYAYGDHHGIRWSEPPPDYGDMR